MVPRITYLLSVELLRNITTVQQLNELHPCGDAHFIYLFQNCARFAVAASMKGETLNVKIKNLAR